MKTFFHRFTADLLIALGLFLLPIIFFAPVTLGGKTLIPADNLYQYEPWAAYRAEQGVPEIPHNALLSDLVFQNYQWKWFIRSSISAGEIPLWQPNQFSGTPFLANGQHSALYPFSILYYVLPLDAAYGWFTVSQLWLAGVLMYVFIRGLGLGRSAGAVAGVSYQLSGFFIVSTVHPMIQASAAWLPLLLLMLEFIIQKRPFWVTKSGVLPWVLIGATALGMNFLAGHIEITYYTLMIMALYAAARLVVEILQSPVDMRQQIFSTAGMLILLIVLGFGIGAVQFIPLVEAANDSFRTERESLDEVLSYALPPRHIAKWLMPNVYGNPAHHSYRDMFTGEETSLDWMRSEADGGQTRVTNTDFGIKNYVEGGVYVGILPLLLALLALLYRKPILENHTPPYRLIFVILGVIAAVFMFGTPLYAVLYYLFPGIKQLHTPFRWSWLFTFVICLLAAYGMEILERRKLSIQKISLLVMTGGGVIGVGLLASRLFYGAADSLVERVFEGLAGVNRAFPDAKAFYSYEFRNILTFAVMIFVSGLVIWWSQTDEKQVWGRIGKRVKWQFAAVLLIALDLYLAGYDFNTAADPKWLDYTPPAVTWLQEKQAEEGVFRIQAFDWGENPLIANTGWRYDLQDVRGYDSLFSKQYADYMGRIAPQTGLDFNRINPIAYDHPQALLAPELDQLNVHYIITDWIIRPQEEFGVDDLAEVGLKQVYEDAGVRIYENLDALPRAYGVPDQIDYTTTDLLPATITRYESSTVFVDIETNVDSWLVLADTYHKGWRAFVRPQGTDEKAENEIPITRIEDNFRGVKLEPGVWTVRFRYSPPSFQLGAFTSFVSGMLIIFLLLVWFWNTFIGEAADADSARRVIKNSLAPIFLNLFNRGIDFAFAFVMLRILNPEGAGIYYYAIVIFGWFDILTNFGLNTLLTREVSRDQSQAGRYLTNTTVLRLGLAALGIPLLGLFLLIRDNFVTPPLSQTALIAIGLLYLGLIPNSISTGLSALFYAFEKAEYPAALATISTLVKVTLGLGALLLGWGVIGLAGVSIITNLVTLGMMTHLALPLLHRSSNPSAWLSGISVVLMRGMMSESWSLMLNHLLATVFFKSDVILMEAINGVEIVGIYSTAYKWLDALNIIPAFFTMALLPMMSRQAKENPAALRRNYIFGFKSLVMVALPVAVITTFIARALIGFLGGVEFLPDGGIALQIMIWSIPLGWINSLTQYVLIALDRQRQITFAFVAAVSFNVGGNLIFLPQYSYRAAAITTIFSELVLLIGFYYLLRKDLGKINYGAVLWRPVAASGVMLVALLLLWNVHALLALAAAAVIYPAMLMVLKPLTPEESERIGRVIPARMKALLVRN